MSPTQLYRPVEGPLRNWLRTQADLVPLISSRVYIGVPDGGPTYPLISMHRVAGSISGSAAPVDLPVFQFDCWGNKGDRPVCERIAYTLVSVFDSAVRVQLPMVNSDPAPILFGAKVTLGPLWRPDPAVDRPRFEVDVQLTIAATS